MATVIEAPMISAGANYLGGIKIDLDWKEGIISDREAIHSGVLMAASTANPLKLGAFLETPVPADILKITDFVRNIPLFLSDLSSDLRSKLRDNKRSK